MTYEKQKMKIAQGKKKPANSLAQSVDLLRFEFENILFSLRSKQELQTNTPKRKLFVPGLILNIPNLSFEDIFLSRSKKIKKYISL